MKLLEHVLVLAHHVLQTVLVKSLNNVRMKHVHNGPNGLTKPHVKLMELVFEPVIVSKMEMKALNVLVKDLKSLTVHQKYASMSNVIVKSARKPMVPRHKSVQVSFTYKDFYRLFNSFL